MKKSLTVRILSLALSLLMIVGVMPLSVFAITGAIEPTENSVPTTEYRTATPTDLINSAYKKDKEYWTAIYSSNGLSKHYGKTAQVTHSYMPAYSTNTYSYAEIKVVGETAPISQVGDIISLPQDTTKADATWNSNAYSLSITNLGTRVNGGKIRTDVFNADLGGLDVAVNADIKLNSASGSGSSGIYTVTQRQYNIDLGTSYNNNSKELMTLCSDGKGNFTLRLGTKTIAALPADTYFNLQILVDVGGENVNTAGNSYYVFVNGELVGADNLLNRTELNNLYNAENAWNTEDGTEHPLGFNFQSIYFLSGTVFYDIKNIGVYYYDDTPADGNLKNATRDEAVGVAYFNDFNGDAVDAEYSKLGEIAALGEMSYSGSLEMVSDGNGGTAGRMEFGAGDGYVDVWAGLETWNPVVQNSGRSFVFSVDLKKGNIVNKGALFSFADRAPKNADGESMSTNIIPIYKDLDGSLYLGYHDGYVSTSITTASTQLSSAEKSGGLLCKLSDDYFTTVAVQVNVQENWFSVYINGIDKTGKLNLLSPEDQARVKAAGFANGFALTNNRINYHVQSAPDSLTMDNVMLYFGDEYKVSTIDLGYEFKTPNGYDIAKEIGAENLYLFTDFNSATGTSESALNSSASHRADVFGFHLNGSTLSLIDDGNGGNALQMSNATNTNLNYYLTKTYRGVPEAGNKKSAYVVSMDVKAGESMIDGQLLTLSGYAKTNDNTALYTAIPLYVKANGDLYVPDTTNGILTVLNGWRGTSYSTKIGNVNKDSYTNVSVQVNSKENWFMVYINGEAKTGRLMLASEAARAAYAAAGGEALADGYFYPTNFSFGYRGKVETANHYYSFDNIAFYYANKVVTRYVQDSEYKEPYITPNAEQIKAQLGDDALVSYVPFDDGTATGGKVGLGGFTRNANWQFVSDGKGGYALQTTTGKQQNTTFTLGGEHGTQITAYANKSYIISMDFKLTADTVAKGSLFYLYSSVANTYHFTAMPVWVDGDGNLYNGQVTSSITGSTSKKVIDSGTMWYQNDIAPESTMLMTADKMIGKLSASKFTNVAVAVDSANNVYSIYIDGECVAANQKLACDTMLNYYNECDAADGTVDFGGKFATSAICIGYRGAISVPYVWDNITMYLGNELVDVREGQKSIAVGEFFKSPTGDEVKSILGSSSLLYYNSFDNLTANPKGWGTMSNGIGTGNMLPGGDSGVDALTLVDDGNGGYALQYVSSQQMNFAWNYGSRNAQNVANSGKSFTFSADFKLGTAITAGNLICIQSTVTGASGAVHFTAIPVWVDANGNLYNGQVKTPITGSTSKISITSGTLWQQNDINVSSNNVFQTADRKIGQLSADKFTNVAVSVDVAKNSYTIYIDGIAVAKNQTFACKNMLDYYKSTDEANGTLDYANGFGVTAISLGYRNKPCNSDIILDNWLAYYGTELVNVTGGDNNVTGYYAANDGKVYYYENGKKLTNTVSRDGILKIDENGAVSYNGKYISSMYEVYTLVGKEIVPKNGYYKGFYQGNMLLGNANGNIFYYDTDGNRVVDKMAYDVNDDNVKNLYSAAAYSFDANGVANPLAIDGIYDVKGGKRCYIDGKRTTGFISFGGKYYYADELTGLLCKGVKRCSDTQFYMFGEDYTGSPITVANTPVADSKGNIYSDFKTAYESVSEGDTLTVTGNINLSGQNVDIGKGITIDLAGNTVKADSIVVFSGTKIVDTYSQKGVIDVPKGNLIYSGATVDNNVVLWNENGNGYSFYQVIDQHKIDVGSACTADKAKFKFRPSLDNSSAANMQIFGDGLADNSLKLVTNIYAMNGDEIVVEKSFVLPEKLLKQVYSGTNKAFQFSLFGGVKYTSIKITYELISEVGLVCRIGEVSYTPSERTGHSYTVEERTPDYLKTAADCSHKAVYYKKCEGCSCYDESITYEYGTELNHSYVSGKCLWCSINAPEQECIHVVKTGQSDMLIANFGDKDKCFKWKVKYILGFIPTNEIDDENYDKVGTKDGRPVFKWSTSDTATSLTLKNAVNHAGAHAISLSVYNETIPSTPTAINITLTGCKSAITVKLDFTGWRDITVLSDSVTVANPIPNITGVSFKNAYGTTGHNVWIGNITAHTYNFDLIVPNGMSIDNTEMYDKIIDNYFAYTVGGEESQKMLEYKTVIKKADNNTKSAWDLFKETEAGIGEPEKLFNVLVYNQYESGYGNPKVAGNMVTTFYQYIQAMSQGYGTPGSTYYQDPELLADIVAALDYGYDYYYGADIVANGTTYGNWYPWDIGIPQQLIRALVYCRDGLTQAQIEKYLSPFNKILDFPVGSGMNLILMAENVILAGALMRDARRIAVAQYLVNDVFDYVTIDEMGAGKDGGYFTDGSYIQHSVTPYTGSYGLSLMTSLPRMFHTFNGTPFEITGDATRNYFNWAFDSYFSVTYDNKFMANTFGRSVISASETSSFNSLVAGILPMVELAPEDLKADFKSLIRTFMFRAGHDYSSNVPIEFAQLAKDIFKDDSIKIIDDYHITKVFGNMARVVHHGPEYGVAIALSSTKIGKYEAINDANFTGWYQGDGMIYIYTDDMDYSNPYFKYANPYLMPGVTASATERKVTGIHPAIPNASNFAGGVEHGKYGAAGYTLGYIDGTLCNTFIDATNGWKITANKSYFMFDEEIICIGSAIKDVSGTEVRTVVENRFWNDGDKLYINGVLVTDPATYDYLTNPNTAQQDLAANYRTQVNGVNTMYFSNMGGYVFFDTAGDGNSLSYTKFNVTGDPSKGTISDSGSKGSYSFLEITLEHGTGNSSLNGSYYYAYLPEATTGQTEAYYVNPDVKLLSKSDNLHAVLERTLSAVGAVFFAGGTLNVNEEETPVTRIYSSTGAAVMISTDENGQTTVSVSDPTNSLASMTLEIDITGISELVSAEDGVNATVNGNTLKLSINSTGSCGATFDIVVK